MDYSTEHIEGALHRIRREVAVLRIACIVSVMAVIFGNSGKPALSRSTSQDVRAPLRVVDDPGKRLFEFVSDRDGGVFQVYDARGERAVKIDTTLQGGRVAVYNRAKVAALLVTHPGGGRVEVYDDLARRVGELYAEPGAGQMLVYGRTKSPSGGITATPEGGLVFVGHDGQPAVRLMSSDDGGRFSIFDREGKAVYSQP